MNTATLWIRDILATMSSALAASSSDPLIGIAIQGYRVLRRIGQGGMGAVYAAQHETLRQRAALKVLRLDQAIVEQAQVRFLREAQAASTIRHDNLAEIYNYGRIDDKTPYILMEFLEGESVKDCLERHRKSDQSLPLDLVLEIGSKTARVLAELHRRGIVHRDVKPGNLMLVPWPNEPSGQRVKLVDFGIAKLGDETHDVTLTTFGRFVGTAAYASPEQCQMSPDIGPASDVYSLGITLYELLAGQPPFWNTLPGLVLAMHQLHELPPLRPRASHAPAELCALVERMLRKDPAQRPLMPEVEEQLASMPRDAGWLVRRRHQRRRWIMAAMLLVGGGLAGSGTWQVWGPRTKLPPRQVQAPAMSRNEVNDQATSSVPTSGAAPALLPTTTRVFPREQGASLAEQSPGQPPASTVPSQQAVPGSTKTPAAAPAFAKGPAKTKVPRIVGKAALNRRPAAAPAVATLEQGTPKGVGTPEPARKPDSTKGSVVPTPAATAAASETTPVRQPQALPAQLQTDSEPIPTKPKARLVAD